MNGDIRQYKQEGLANDNQKYISVCPRGIDTGVQKVGSLRRRCLIENLQRVPNFATRGKMNAQSIS